MGPIEITMNLTSCNKVSLAVLGLFLAMFVSLNSACSSHVTKESVFGCSSGRWKCSSEDKCIPNAWRCDGKFTDCIDLSDEQFCGAQKGANLNLKERPFDQM